MSKNLFIGNIISSLGELGTDLAAGNWGGVVQTVVDDVAQGLFLKYGSNEDLNPRLSAAINHDATHVIGLAILALHCASLTAGFAQEDEGNSFETTRAWLAAADSALKSSGSGSTWQGPASQAYASRVDQLRTLIDDLAALDQSMENILKKQAGEVDTLRNVFGYLITGLTVSMGISIALYIKPFIGPLMSIVFQYAVSISALTTAVTYMGITISRQADNAGVVRNTIDGYRKVVSEVPATPPVTPPVTSNGAGRAAPAGVRGSDVGPSADSAASAGPHEPDALRVEAARLETKVVARPAGDADTSVQHAVPAMPLLRPTTSPLGRTPTPAGSAPRPAAVRPDPPARPAGPSIASPGGAAAGSRSREERAPVEETPAEPARGAPAHESHLTMTED